MFHYQIKSTVVFEFNLFVFRNFKNWCLVTLWKHCSKSFSKFTQCVFVKVFYDLEVRRLINFNLLVIRIHSLIRYFCSNVFFFWKKQIKFTFKLSSLPISNRLWWVNSFYKIVRILIGTMIFFVNSHRFPSIFENEFNTFYPWKWRRSSTDRNSEWFIYFLD